MHTNLIEYTLFFRIPDRYVLIHYSLVEYLIDMFLYHKQLNEFVCLHGK